MPDTTQTLRTVTSADGTTIAYDRVGDGPPVVLVSGGFLAWDTNRFREDAIEEVRGQANLVAENASSAVAFADPAVATETLNTLRARPRILVACVYSGEELFATYETRQTRCHLLFAACFKHFGQGFATTSSQATGICLVKTYGTHPRHRPSAPPPVTLGLQNVCQ